MKERMEVNISKIKVLSRIRRQLTNIVELADGMERLGLLQPIVLMRLPDDAFQLIAGNRRLVAAKSLGWTMIDASIHSAMEAEEAMAMEDMENMQREGYSFEDMAYRGKMLETIENAKARERMAAGGQGGMKEGTDGSPYLSKGESRDAVGEKLHISGRQYDRVKYIDENASPELIQQLNNKEVTISKAYDDLRASSDKPVPIITVPSQSAAPVVEIRPLAGRFRKIVEENETLKASLQQETARANKTVHGLRVLEEHHSNIAKHGSAKIDMLSRQVQRLQEQLGTAESPYFGIQDIAVQSSQPAPVMNPFDPATVAVSGDIFALMSAPHEHLLNNPVYAALYASNAETVIAANSAIGDLHKRCEKYDKRIRAYEENQCKMRRRIEALEAELASIGSIETATIINE
ncbi:hypothetical protein FACS1894184_03010 [Clostridia bacterium]|nr:hypothetical protein FACS1894184_03010 [Clostridia bacterium]